MGCKNRNPDNTFNFIRWRRANNVTISDLPLTELCPIALIQPPPSNLVAVVNTSNSITVTWDHPFATDFILERSTDQSLWTPSFVNGNSLNVNGLDPGTRYYFRVKVFTGGANSEYSEVVSEETFYEILGTLEFDGVNDFVQLDGLNALNGTSFPADFSFGLWVNLSAVTTDETLLHFTGRASGGSDFLILLQPRANPDEVLVRVNFFPNGAAATGTQIVLDRSVKTKYFISWSLLGLVESDLYVDGVKVDNASMISGVPTTWAANNVLGYRVGSTQYFGGIIGEIFMMNRSLTPSEHAALWRDGNGRNPTNLIPIEDFVFLYRANEPSGTALTDDSDNSYAATLTNGVTRGTW